MPRHMTFLIVVMLLGVAPAAHASGGWMIGLNGGWTFPTGDYGSTGTNGLGATSGPQLGFEVDYQASDRIAVGIEGAFVRHTLVDEGDVADLGGGLTRTIVKDRFEILRFNALAKFIVPLENPSVRSYGLLGVGVYDMTHDYEYRYETFLRSVSVTDESDNAALPGSRIGVNLGLGMMFRVSERIGIDVRGDFNFISMDQNTFGRSQEPVHGPVSSAQYIGLQAGVVYNFRL